MHALEECVFSVGFSFGYKDIYVYIFLRLFSFISYYMILNIVPCAMHGDGNGTPLQYFCLENNMDGGAW